MRVFVALTPTYGEQEAIHRATSRLRDTQASLRWVPPEALHLTLKFLGEVHPEAVETVRDVVGSVAARHGPQHLVLGGVGMFPGSGRPRVVWLGVVPKPGLLSLRDAVEDGLAGAGFPRDDKPFRAHVTLGRTRRPLSRAQASQLRHAGETVDYRGRVRVGTVDVIRSHLGRSGSHYEMLASLDLAGLEEGAR